MRNAEPARQTGRWVQLAAQELQSGLNLGEIFVVRSSAFITSVIMRMPAMIIVDREE